MWLALATAFRSALMTFIRFIIFFLCVAGIPQFASAHQVTSVEFEFLNLESQWEVRGEMDIAYMLPETRRNPFAGPMSRDDFMKSSPEEMQRIRRETENTLRQIISLSFAGEDISWRIEFPDFDKEPFDIPVMYGDWALLTVHLIVDAQPGPGELKAHWSSEEEAQLIMVSQAGEKRQIFSVSPGGEQVLWQVDEAGGGTVSSESAFGGWILTGYRHVLPLGLDHMLFIFGLFLMSMKWRPLLWQSLLFTISHSITLALVVLGWVQINETFVEILIAFSIAFIGVENLLTKKIGKLRYSLVFGFGLIHGMGFASVLGEKLTNVPREELIQPLLAFNLGVEVAQITVLAASFLLFRLIKKHTRAARISGSVLVTLAGLGWMIERIFLG